MMGDNTRVYNKNTKNIQQNPKINRGQKQGKKYFCTTERNQACKIQPLVKKQKDVELQTKISRCDRPITAEVSKNFHLQKKTRTRPGTAFNAKQYYRQ